MKTATRSRSSSVTSTADVLPRAALVPNPWNPNRMTAAMYAKALESIETFGFIDPLTVYPRDDGIYMIIDGEHRFRAGCDLGMVEFPVVILFGIREDEAKKLTIIMNELHGQADPDRMGQLLTELRDLTSMEELLVALPYDESVLAGFMGLPTLPPLPGSLPPTASPGDSKEPWVERLYKLPKTAALMVDEAIEKAKDGEEIESWQALERVAADYLAS